MRFPYHVRFRKAEATIYTRTRACPFYRLSYYVAGRRRIEKFRSFSDALATAQRKVRELASGNQVSSLTAREVSEVLGAKVALAEYRRETGRDATLLGSVTNYLHAQRRLHGKPLSELVDHYLASLVTVRPKDVGEAVREFLDSRRALTVAANPGARPPLSPKYFYGQSIRLLNFASTFPSTTTAELTKQHIDQFFGSLAELTGKSRNHYRADVRQFCDWAVRKDFLPGSNRLAEADGMRPERSNTAEVEFYTPTEFRALLEGADDELRPQLAVAGLCGLRTAEILRLTWADVWHVAGHIEVTARKSKTRSRRLVPIAPALQAWLQPFAARTGPLWTQHEVTYHEKFNALCERVGVERKENGLRHSYCTYAYVLHGEVVAAQWAGNSPSQLHQHYRGLCTRSEAERWFGTMPAKADNVIAMTATTNA